MDAPDLQTFLNNSKDVLASGPVAMIFVEDLVEVDSTIHHHLNLGFKGLILFAPPELRLSEDLPPIVHRVNFDCHADNALTDAVNAVIKAAPPATWLYYCHNAEYLYYPFCETRTVGEMLAFHAEERRDSMLCYVVDLYADDLEAFPNAVSLEHAHLDKSGYYALARQGENKERQLDFFGGLRWRYEEHVPKTRRRIDRIALFRARKDLELLDNHVFSDEEYNTYACPWHHNITAAICSFRTAKALKLNPGSTFDIQTFKWHNSTPFSWKSRQLLDLGLMEPGQWF